MVELHSKFVERINNEFGSDANAFLEALVTEPVTSIRINTQKVTDAKLTDVVPWASNAMYLSQRPVFTLDPIFNVGGYYVQEASSMFVEQAFKQHVTVSDDLAVLDLCASPGGKSTLLASLLNGKGMLVSNEVVSQRVAPLRENLTKWGYPNSVVINSDPSVIGKCEGLFDVILVDAPCSGEGMFRKDEVAIKEWSPENVEMCANRQRSILSDIFPALKVGGILIYSTCTYNKDEDENNVKWICSELGGELLPVSFNKDWGIDDSGFGYHFYPYRTRGEGFFLAAIRKTAETQNCSLKVKNSKVVQSQGAKLVKDFIVNPSDFQYTETPDKMIIATPSRIADKISYLRSNVRVVQAGVAVAQLKGKDVIPGAPLALSSILNRKSCKTVELDWTQAMAFLKRESFALPECEKGWLLALYKGVALGWLKNLGNRTNSLYPAEWHVRMQADASQYTPLF